MLASGWKSVKTFLKHSRWGFVVLGLLVFLMAVLETTRPFEYLRAALIDAFTQSKTVRHPDNLVIVEISSDDYKTLFGAKSPLEPGVVLDLIEAAQQLNPKVIGVDLDTSDPQWACAPEQKLKALTSPYSKVVWAQVPIESHENGEDADEGPPKITIAPVLGGILSEGSQMGLVRFPQDVDGYVRSFQSSYLVQGPIAYYERDPGCAHTRDGIVPMRAPEAKKSLGAPDMPAFFHRVAHYRGPAQANKEMKYLRFREARYSFFMVDAGQLLAKDSKGQIARRPLESNGVSRLNEPIVLIGGTYPEARDQYYTPLGPMPGVELIANAVESELGESTTVVGPGKTALFDATAGLAIILIYFVFRRRPHVAFFSSVLAMVAAVAAGSLLFYSRAAAFLNLVPVMLGMVIHQMIEGTTAAVHLRRELSEKEDAIEHLKNELAEAQLDMAFKQQASPVAAATLPIAPLIIVETTESTTVVEKEPEHSHAAGKAKKTHPHKRGHAAGK
jgi:CHASE2 domain-containing sensor protein